MYICMYVRRYITIQLIMVYVNGWCQFPAIPEDDGGRHKSSAVNLLLQTHRTLRNSKHQSDIKVYDEYDDHIAIQSIQVHPVYTYIEYTIYIYIYMCCCIQPPIDLGHAAHPACCKVPICGCCSMGSASGTNRKGQEKKVGRTSLQVFKHWFTLQVCIDT